MASGQEYYIQEWLDAQSSTPIALDEVGSAPADVEPDSQEYDQGLGLATRLYQLGRQGLQQLCRQDRCVPRLSSSQSALREELGRLYLWGEAFEDGKLDKALEQSEDLRDTVLEFLCAIGDSIIRASQPYPTLTVESARSTEQIRDLRILTEQAKSIVSKNVDQASSEGSEDEEEYGVSKDEVPNGENNIAGELQFHISCLVDLGFTLEKSLLCTETSRVRSSETTPLPFHISDAASVYISIIRDKFKDAEAQLIERLGEANWQRHVNVRMRMANVIGDFKEEYIREDPCSTFRPYSAFKDSGIGPSAPTQSQNAPSHRSFVSSVSEKEGGRLRVPREPVEVGAGRPFQCYLCGELLSSIRNRGDWKYHVFADLQPYICTFAKCDHNLVQFSTRAAWADHEFTKHRINHSWKCPECPEKTSTAADWAEHLKAVHQRAFCGPKLEVARDRAYNAESKPSEKEECPFCRGFLGRPRRAFVKHVGSHMEEIALMALPRDRLGDSEDKSVISQEGSMETSRLFAGNHFTQDKSLPDLSVTGSSESLDLNSDGMGERLLNRSLRIMVENGGGALEPTSLPPFMRHDQDPVLECPFTFLKCFEQFAVSDEQNWIQHSLEHFRMNERGPESLDPPRNNSCCFCPQTFQASSGIKSWRARMDHVKVHQEHFGHRLAAARPDFALIEYFWQNGLLSRANYQELNPKAKAVEEDPQSISSSDPGLLVEEEVVSRASHNSGKEAVHGPAG